MRLGTSIFLLAAGAILRYAVTEHVSGISLPVVGAILMLAGVVGLLASLLYIAAARRPVPGERVTTRDTYEQPPL